MDKKVSNFYQVASKIISKNLQQPAFSTLPLALSKVLIMMTGELSHEIFYELDPTNSMTVGVMGHLFFVMFVITVTIILFNLLIGLTVSDIQGLRAGAQVSLLWCRLEQIYFMECFIFGKYVVHLASLAQIGTDFFKKFQIAKDSGGEM